MRVKSIELSNYLSYGPKTKIDFNDTLTVIIGPNGSGKSNIFRAIETVAEVLDDGSPGISQHSDTSSQIVDSAYESSQIVLEIDLSAAHEKEEIDSFIKIALLHGLKNSFSRNNTTLTEDDKQNLLEKVLNLTISDSLASGFLYLTHDLKSASRWQACYRVKLGQFQCDLFLDNSTGYVVTSKRNQPSSGLPPDLNLALSNIANDSIGELFYKMSGENITFTNLITHEDKTTSLFVMNNILHGWGYNLDGILSNFEKRVQHYPWYQTTSMPRLFTFKHLLNSFFQRNILSDSNDSSLGKGVDARIENLAVADMPIYHRKEIRIPTYLEKLYRWQSGDREGRERFKKAQQIFRQLRGKGESFRLQVIPGRPFPPNPTELTGNPPVATQEEFKEYLAKTSTYWFKLQTFIERSRQDTKAEGRGEMTMEVATDKAGSGAAELVRLSTFLATEPSSVLLLDEPMARLHPMAQKRFMQYLENSDFQCIMISHAPGLFPDTDIENSSPQKENSLSKVVKSIRLNNKLESQVDCFSFSDNPSELVKKLQEKILQEIKIKPQILNILFAEKVVFVSGESELLLYQYWYSNYIINTSKSPAEEIPYFYSFGGDNHLDVPLAIAMVFNIPWVAILDGNSFDPKGEIESDENTLKVPLALGQIYTATKFAKKGLQEIIKIAEGVKYNKDPDDDGHAYNTAYMENAKTELKELGFFTLANCWDTKKNRNSGDSCNICGRQIATEDHESPPNTAAEYCMESLEAVWRSELTSPKENKIDNCRQLLIDYHKAPEKAEGMFSEIAKFFKNTAGIS